MRFFPENIAIVGNSDKETGTQNGSLIDSFDNVLRFNNWSTSEKFWGDYGKKTTHWSHSMHKSVKRRDKSKFNRVYIPFPLFDKRCPRKYDMYEQHFWDFERETVVMPFFLFRDLFNLIKLEIGVDKPNPSTGISLLYWLWRDRESALDKTSLFGFANFSTEFKHHYFIGNNLELHPNLLTDHPYNIENKIFEIITCTNPREWGKLWLI